MIDDPIDYANDWAGEQRKDPVGGNAMVLREISGSHETGYSMRINDIFGGHDRWLALFEWLSWEKLS